MIEVEVKATIGEPERFRAALLTEGYLVDMEDQLNHYYLGQGDISKVVARIDSKDAARELTAAAKGNKISVRTRWSDATGVWLVVKISSDDPENGQSRQEFSYRAEALTIGELDEMVAGAGFEIDSKWSRSRENYVVGPINVALDFNAGYGWLAEAERLIDDKDLAKRDQILEELTAFLTASGAELLDQGRLGRMYQYMRANWRDYYRTRNVFIVK